MRKHIMLAAALLTATATILPSGVQAATMTMPRAQAADAATSYVEKARRVVVIKRRGPRVVYVRPWHRRPYYGTLIGGIALGSLLAASYYYARPEPPDDGLCWYWANPSHTRGYWDYCD